MTDILRLAVPLTAWLASFSAVYGLHGLICSERWSMLGLEGIASGRTFLISVWLLAIAVQVAFLLALRSPRIASGSPFVTRVSTTLAVVSLVATVWTLFPAIVTSLCLPPSFPS